MSMFCFQCQEAARNEGCTIKGMCGKDSQTATMQDLLIFVSKGIGVCYREARTLGIQVEDPGEFLLKALFTTVTNVSFDAFRVTELVTEGLELKKRLLDQVKDAAEARTGKPMADAALWQGNLVDFQAKADQVGVLATENEDVRSLRELLVYGLKGIAAYGDHAHVLGFDDKTITDFLADALASTTDELSVSEMVGLVLKAGEVAVTTMALLDKANTGTYGHPQVTEVNIGVGSKPGILISGHDLRDLEDLLEQTRGTGIDVYTHGEMLPAHYYPRFKEYDNLVGNYGGSWFHQQKEFEAFGGPILMTTNCLVPVKDSYKDRLFTTGVVAWPGVTHIQARSGSGRKDFSVVIEKAKSCKPPVELETGSIVGGFAHNQVMAVADKVVDAVKTGAIKRFVVMAGCDGRNKGRDYFTDVAKNLPEDTVILTAGCAKYRYNKLNLGDIGGIPRVLDAGQCNDSYSLAVIALKLKEVFGLDDINKLPLSFDIAWYEQKAVTVLLALLYLGVKGIRLGPTLPAFLSPNVAKVLVENFDIKLIGEVEADVAAIMAGK